MWRPGDWDTQALLNEIIVKSNCSWLLHGQEAVFFEAGADAILKAVLPLLEKEVRAHTSAVSAQAIIGGEVWSGMVKQ